MLCVCVCCCVVYVVLYCVPLCCVVWWCVVLCCAGGVYVGVGAVVCKGMLYKKITIFSITGAIDVEKNIFRVVWKNAEPLLEKK